MTPGLCISRLQLPTTNIALCGAPSFQDNAPSGAALCLKRALPFVLAVRFSKIPLRLGNQWRFRVLRLGAKYEAPIGLWSVEAVHTWWIV
jgi:hypothetical protein